jgi:hypothetical protein
MLLQHCVLGEWELLQVGVYASCMHHGMSSSGTGYYSVLYLRSDRTDTWSGARPAHDQLSSNSTLSSFIVFFRFYMHLNTLNDSRYHSRVPSVYRNDR